MRLVASCWNTILDFVYPPLCLCCEGLIDRAGSPVCADCWRAIPRASGSEALFRRTREKLRAEGKVDELVALFVFEKGGAFQHIAHAVKYRAYERLAGELGQRLGGVVRESGICPDAIVPVPLHRVKFRERGYNQAERIAQGIAEVVGCRVAADAVRRVRHTTTQTKLTIDERRRNMAGAFDAGTRVSGTCLLVDDVITTGATTAACAEALRQAGAERVIAAAIALAQKDADRTD